MSWQINCCKKNTSDQLYNVSDEKSMRCNAMQSGQNIQHIVACNCKNGLFVYNTLVKLIKNIFLASALDFKTYQVITICMSFGKERHKKQELIIVVKMSL